MIVNNYKCDNPLTLTAQRVDDLPVRSLEPKQSRQFCISASCTRISLLSVLLVRLSSSKHQNPLSAIFGRPKKMIITLKTLLQQTFTVDVDESLSVSRGASARHAY